MNKKFVILAFVIAIIMFAGFYFCFQNRTEAETEKEFSNLGPKLVIAQGNALLALSPIPQTEIKVVKRMKVLTTAYSSTVWQTDDTPFITASGTYVKDGIVANNLLAFGTKIRFPEIYGDKVFVVEDRMHWEKGYYHVDIWFPSYYEAKNFGAKTTYIEVIKEI
ncbi:3D domain-containing protein [Candidatus Parcubacteria bacterium]|nr:3D domain-containing protein [Candidatus Parcubacteria bacterium]